jgi:gluconate 2-dehydrogenase gamma chain
MTDRMISPLKPGAIEHLLATDHVTEATRRALRTRLAWKPGAPPRCFSKSEFGVLVAVCNRLIPQRGEAQPILLAAMLDERLSEGPSDGWRYDALPPDRVAFVRGVNGIEHTAQSLFQDTFISLGPDDQDAVLRDVQQGQAVGDPWTGMPAARFFEELLAAVVELYYAHPHAQEEIGYVGMADAQGFKALGLNRRDPIEDEASNAPL